MGQKLELGRVHVLEKVPGSLQYKLMRTQTAVRLCREGRTVWIQRGTLFDDGGEPMPKDQVPSWFADEVKTLNPSVLKECGYAPKGV